MGKLGYQDVFQKRLVWKQISEKYSGEFSIIRTKDNVLEILKLVLIHKGIHIELTESDTRPLKLSFDVEFLKQFEFNIYQEDFTDKISKFLGKKEMQVKDEEFNERFFLKSKNEFLLREFLDDSDLIMQLKKLNVYTLNCEYDKKTNMYHFLSVFSYNIVKKNTYDDIIQLHFLIIRRFEELNLLSNK